MKKAKSFFIVLIALAISSKTANAQTWTTQGTTTPSTTTGAGTTTYNLTPLTAPCTDQDGALWCNSTVDFTQPFEIDFEAYFDVVYTPGADGICVVFGQFPTTTLPVAGGGNLGIYGVTGTAFSTHSYAIEFDTYPNPGDPGYDHTTITKNTDIATPMPGATPVPIDPTATAPDYVKDEIWRNYRVTWDPATQTMLVCCDGNVRIISHYDYLGNFSTPTTIRWGFTGSTGSYCSNHFVKNISLTVLDVTVTDVVHCGDFATLTATPPAGGVGYYWFPTEETTSSINVTSGTYSVIAYSYTTCASTMETFHVTVNPLPVITCTLNPICAGATTTLTATPGGGTWVSTTLPVATIGSSSGILTGVDNGTSVIIYTEPGATSCTATKTMTVEVMPGSISAPSLICQGTVWPVSNPSPGGTWSSSDAAVASITPSTGFLTTASPGTTTITYTNVCGSATKIVTVEAVITITLTATPSSICAGAVPAIHCTLNATTAGGGVSPDILYTWNPGGILCLGCNTLEVTPASTTTYTVTVDDGACNASANVTVTVNPAPVITGTVTMCAGTTVTLNAAPTGGTWSSGNSSIATVGSATGVVGGVSAGLVTISYTTAEGCVSTHDITVIISPTAITGTKIVCEGATTTLNVTPAGGTWSSGSPLVAPVDVITGVVYGLSGGTATITYANPCGTATTTVTVIPLPAFTGGSTLICLSTSTHTTTLNATPAGGTWSSSNTAVATVETGGTGIIYGIAVGTTTITYTTTCGYATTTVTVLTVPTEITGTLYLCQGTTTTLNGTPAGGTWTSSDGAVANVGVSTGVVIGLSGGTSTITYTNPCGYITATVTVEPLPAFTGGTTYHICSGASTTLTLTATPAGGTWSSSDPSVATVGSSTGVVYGVSYGTATITYTTGCGFVTADFTYVEEPTVCLYVSTIGTFDYFNFVSSSPTATFYFDDIDYINEYICGPWGPTSVPTVPVLNSVYYYCPPLGAAAGGYDGICVVGVSEGGCYWDIPHSSSCCALVNPDTSFIGYKHANPNNVISHQAITQELTVIPNPNKGSFMISGTIQNTNTSTEAKIEVMDMLGKVVLVDRAPLEKGVISKNITLDNNVANGVYLLRVVNENDSHILRFTLDR